MHSKMPYVHYVLSRLQLSTAHLLFAYRSVVVTYKNGNKKCGTLKEAATGSTAMEAKAVFRDQQGGPVSGTIRLKQYKYTDGSRGETTIDTDGLSSSGGAVSMGAEMAIFH